MCSFCTRLMDSSPPPTMMSTLSTMIVFAATAMAIIPDEHWRSIDIPGTVAGNQAARPTSRPMLGHWLPCCMAQPMMTSSISAGSTPDLSTAACTDRAPSVGASVSLKAPR